MPDLIVLLCQRNRCFFSLDLNGKRIGIPGDPRIHPVLEHHFVRVVAVHGRYERLVFKRDRLSDLEIGYIVPADILIILFDLLDELRMVRLDVDHHIFIGRPAHT